MNTDIRILTTFPYHHKTKKLRRKLGAEGVCALIFLWIFAADNRPDGTLAGMDDDDICIACQWDGDAEVLISALVDIGFVDKNEDGYSIHGWVENNPWAAGAPERKAKASAAAKAKWAKKYAQTPNMDATSINIDATSNATSSIEQCSNMLLADFSNAPSPSPSPSPKNLSSTDAEDGDYYLTKKNRKLSGKRLETFNLFWEAFDYKKSRSEAADAWLDIPQLTDRLVDQIILAAKREAQQRPQLIAQNKTPKMPQGWISSRRWEDESQPAAKQEHVSPHIAKLSTTPDIYKAALARQELKDAQS